MLTPGELTLRARIGAYALHAKRDPRETTAPARAAFLAKFLDAVDPERRLPEAERLRRAECARKAHFTRLALASARAWSKHAAKTPTRGHRATDPVLGSRQCLDEAEALGDPLLTTVERERSAFTRRLLEAVLPEPGAEAGRE